MRVVLLILLASAALIVGCPKQQAVQQPAKEPLTETAPATPFPEQPATPAPKPEAPPPPAKPAQPASGWRVQIFVSGTLENARRVAEEARWKFSDQQIFIAEQEPYFKVQVGNGLSRVQADQLRQRAKEVGYQGAFPVEVVF